VTGIKSNRITKKRGKDRQRRQNKFEPFGTWCGKKVKEKKWGGGERKKLPVRGGNIRIAGSNRQNATGPLKLKKTVLSSREGG